MRKRVMSLVLAAVMLLGLAPAALADSGRSRRESFMSVAESQLGYREKFQNGTKYGSWYGLPGQPWCAMFVSWCARYSGVPESVIPNFSGSDRSSAMPTPCSPATMDISFMEIS